MLIIALAAAALPLEAAAQLLPVPGASAHCSDFRLQLTPFGLSADISDEGWVRVALGNPGRPVFRSVAGVVSGSGLAAIDMPTNHNSHDMDFSVLVDEAFTDLLSTANRPNTEGRDDLDVSNGDDLRAPTRIGVEWETGVFPGDVGPSVTERYFPRWVWPSVGDRVWADGNWVFDCGHAKERGYYERFVNPPRFIVTERLYRSEIHPPRAVATMRRRADTLPGTGTTPVPVVSTDLYLHGRAGFITDILNCGMGIIVDGVNGSGNPDTCPVKTNPIAEDFEFDVCVPPRPSGQAELTWRVDAGPGNTVPGFGPDITVVPAPAGCANDDPGNAFDPADVVESYDLHTALRVRVPLAGSGVADVETYARRIVAGWVEPPPTPLTRLRMTFDRLNLHQSGDGGLASSDDGELTFFYVNVNRAATPWVRLADHAAVASNGNSVLNDADPSLFGDSYFDLSGAVLDFYVPPADDVNIASRPYDQDCLDRLYGYHLMSLAAIGACYTIGFEEGGQNDALKPLDATLKAPDFGLPASPDGIDRCPGLGGGSSAACTVTTGFSRYFTGTPSNPSSVLRPDYELDLTVERVDPDNEDVADLRLTQTCVPSDEVWLVGRPLTCTVTATNPGPGLPRSVDITIDVAATALAPTFSVGAPRLIVNGIEASTVCQVSGPAIACRLNTLRVGGQAVVVFTIVPEAPGTITSMARVTTLSTDPNPADNTAAVATEVFLPVTIDVEPGRSVGSVSPIKSGVVPVALITSSDFDATSVVATSVCFGDAEAPSERACAEAHGTTHPVDVDRDRDTDVVMHFEAQTTGIDFGDTRACLVGRTRAGVAVYGCDVIVTPQ